MVKQPRSKDGKFKKQKSVSTERRVTFYLSEYECRIIGNRLQRAAKRYSELHDSIYCTLNQECSHWSNEFQSQANTQSARGYEPEGKKRHLKQRELVKIHLTPYECWVIGNRLFETGEWFGKKGYDEIEQETKWMARKFHAERNEVKDTNE
jgi:hypothetical protein